VLSGGQPAAGDDEHEAAERRRRDLLVEDDRAHGDRYGGVHERDQRGPCRADLGSDGIPWWAVIQVMLVCVGYASAPFIAARHLSSVPDIGVVALSLSTVALVYAPFAWIAWPSDTPPAKAWAAVIALGVLCTAIAFVVFFKLIAEIGPARATLITFVNPAVAVAVGAIVLDERITAATLGGFALVIAGCWLATRQHR